MIRYAIRIEGPKGCIPFTLHRNTKREADEVAARYRETNTRVTVQREDTP